MERGPHYETFGLLGGQRMPSLSPELERRDRARMRELNRLIREGKATPPKRAELDADDVRSIKRALRDGMSVDEIRRKFRLTLRATRDIISGRTWAHVAA